MRAMGLLMRSSHAALRRVALPNGSGSPTPRAAPARTCGRFAFSHALSSGGPRILHQHGRTTHASHRAHTASPYAQSSSDDDAVPGATPARPASTTAAAAPTPETAETLPRQAGGSKRVIVVGGNGFVGSAVCKRALFEGFEVVSVSRSGPPPTKDPWVKRVTWHQADVFDEASWKELFPAECVVSSLGLISPNVSDMERMNGDAPIAAVQLAKAMGCPKFVMVSAHDYNLPEPLKQTQLVGAYFGPKRRAEERVLREFPEGGVIVRPSLIYGSRLLPSGYTLPLDVVGRPLEFLSTLSPLGLFKEVPGSDLLLATPVSVEEVASAVLAGVKGAATSQVLTYHDIKQA